MNVNARKVIPHLIVVLLLIVISLAYFSPVLQGKEIFQSDIVQYIGMAKEQDDFRKQTGEEPYWTNSAFGGMPTYQLGANYPHNYIKKLDRIIRFLPRPADYLFLYFIGFYVLLLVLKTDWRFAFLGALAFGFSTYFIIILGVGHNAKAHAIGYFPLVLAGIFLVFQRRYLWGFLLMAIAMALQINANHFQMTYYLMFLVLVIGLVYLVDAYKKKELPHFFKSVGLLAVAVLLSLVINATNLMATREYAQWSTRSPSELTINPDGSPKEKSTGLSRDYITEYSYGISESLNLFVPRLFGGSNGEALGESSKTYKFLVNQGVPRSQAREFAESLPTYWGDQPIVAAPAYIGAVILFLFVMALFLVKGPVKWWLVGGTLLSLLLSWGKNFGLLTDLMIDYFPLYNKFRAVSSAQVILELCVPALAVLGLYRLFNADSDRKQQLKALKNTSMIMGAVLLLLFILKGTFGFQGLNDAYYRQQFTQMGLPQLFDIIVLDRKAMYTNDLLRSFVFVLLAAGTLWGFLKGKLKQNYALIVFALLILTDLVGAARRYVNNEDFVSSRVLDKPYQSTAADDRILKDTARFRVFEPALGVAGARTSYFHQAVGGYHAAKPKRFNELYDFHIVNNNVEVLSMINVKYILQPGQDGSPVALENPYANGDAWFVNTVLFKDTPDEEIKGLDSLTTRREVIINKNDLAGLPLPASFQTDSTASVTLTSYKPNRLVYKTSNAFEGLAVFSEMYYPHGWKVTVDGEEATHFRANYVLRAMKIPAGTHTVIFTFEPEVVRKGSLASLSGVVILGLLLLGVLFYEFRRRKRPVNEPENA